MKWTLISSSLKRGAGYFRTASIAIVWSHHLRFSSDQALQSKYMGARAVMSKRDEAAISLLKEKERRLDAQAHQLNAAGKGCNRLYDCLRPFFFLFGFFFFVVTIVLLVSMTLTNVDKLINSECGFSCGYVLTKPKRWNPLDAFLVIISQVHAPAFHCEATKC